MARPGLILTGMTVAACVAFPQVRSRVSDAHEMAAQAAREARRFFTHDRWTNVPGAIRQSFNPCEGGTGFTFVGPR